MKKRILLGALGLLLSVSLLACAAPAPAPAPTPVPAPVPAPEKAEVIELKANHFSTDKPGSSGFSTEWFAREIELRTGGRVHIKMYFTGTLVPTSQGYEGTGKGVTDLNWTHILMQPKAMPLTNVGLLPGLFDDPMVGNRAMNELHQMDAIKAENEKNNVRTLMTYFAGRKIILSDKPVNKLDDLKGMKIGASGYSAEALSKIGVVPVGMPPGEGYDALAKGTLDAYNAAFSTEKRWKYYEVAPNMYALDTGRFFFTVIMNLDTYNSLPDDIKAVFDDPSLRLHYQFEEAEWAIYKQDIQGKEAALGAGGKIVYPTEEDLARWTPVVKEIAASWAEERDKEGLAGTEVYNEWIKLLEKWTNYYR